MASPRVQQTERCVNVGSLNAGLSQQTAPFFPDSDREPRFRGEGICVCKQGAFGFWNKKKKGERGRKPQKRRAKEATGRTAEKEPAVSLASTDSWVTQDGLSVKRLPPSSRLRVSSQVFFFFFPSSPYPEAAVTSPPLSLQPACSTSPFCQNRSGPPLRGARDRLSCAPSNKPPSIVSATRSDPFFKRARVPQGRSPGWTFIAESAPLSLF